MDIAEKNFVFMKSGHGKGGRYSNAWFSPPKEKSRPAATSHSRPGSFS
jgi:hypothetical protein